MIDDLVVDLLRGGPGPDEESSRAVTERARRVLRPTGALSRLDEIATWLAAWQRTRRPSVRSPLLAIFVASHGVADMSVSAYPAHITASMLRALREGVATATAMARALGVRVNVVDVGVGEPSENIVYRPALSEERFLQCFDAGRGAVSDLVDLLVLGEMGIGNTTAASAVAAALFGGPAEEWTGRGTGIDDETWRRKAGVVEAARERAGPCGPMETLRQLGGSELVAIAGAIVEARRRSVPVVLDGFVVTAPAAALEIAVPGSLDHCVAGHRSAEPGHAALLAKLGKEPLIDLGLRLGEGSGALAAVPLIELASVAVNDVATFEEFGV